MVVYKLLKTKDDFLGEDRIFDNIDEFRIKLRMEFNLEQDTINHVLTRISNGEELINIDDIYVIHVHNNNIDSNPNIAENGIKSYPAYFSISGMFNNTTFSGLYRIPKELYNGMYDILDNLDVEEDNLNKGHSIKEIIDYILLKDTVIYVLPFTKKKLRSEKHGTIYITKRVGMLNEDIIEEKESVIV